MSGGGPRSRGQGGHVEGFASRPFERAEAVKALDSMVDGFRMLGVYAGIPEDRVGTTTSFAELVQSASDGMPKYVKGEQRHHYNALFVAVGARCRKVLDRMIHSDAGQGRDPVVASAFDRFVAGLSDDATTLLRIAVAAELARVDAAGSRRAEATNPLRGVVDLYEMGAVVSSGPGNNAVLRLASGQQMDLEWTGSVISRNVAGRLRPAPEVDLSF